MHVTVLGGGFGAAELLLALRSLAEERVELELIAADSVLPLRIASTGAAFEARPVPVYDLERLAADVGAAFRRDRAEAVAADARRVRLASGAIVSYDALVVAVGARATVGVPGASMFRDQRDARMVRRLATDVRSGAARRVAFAVPPGVAWTLPLYELSLLTAAEAERHGLGTQITVVTPERAPLDVFGAEVSAGVEQVLARRGVRVLSATVAHSVSKEGVRLSGGDVVHADRVIAVPRLVGRRITGLPADLNGFVATDGQGHVDGRPDVFAIGDVTRFPVKQGGVATQQADIVATEIARQAGARFPSQPPTIVLGSQLLGAGEPLYMRAELNGDGLLREGTAALSEEPPWWPAGKLFSRHLTPWMAEQGLQAGPTR